MKNKFKIYFYILIFLFGVFNYAQASLMVSCQSSPNPADVNETVNFSSSVSGETGNYTYDWYGACLGSGVNCSRPFSSEGVYTAYLDVTSGQEFQTASCPVNVVAPQSCASHNYKACYNGDSYWYDSCGTRQELYQDCGSETCSSGQCQTPSCTPNSYKACYNDDVYWFDSCGARQNIYQYCDSGQTCQNGQCVNNCSSHNYTACYNDDVYWYDSCGTRQELYQNCGSGTCSNGQCQNNYCTSHSYTSCYYNDVYWYDSCGTRQELYQDCGNGTCSGGQCQSNYNLMVSCSASPSTASVNQSVNFYATASGGTGSYTYNWSGACTNNSSYNTYSNCQNSFSGSGTYTANVTVYSGGQTASNSCSVYVSQNQNNYCVNSGSNYCQGNDVYIQQICYYGSQSYTLNKLVQNCLYNQTCQSGVCVNNYTPPIEYKSYKACYGNAIYWYSQNGKRLSLYSNCSTANSCYKNSCKSAKCVHDLKCDGSTCEQGSKNYCDVCQHVGDGTCNCGETASSSSDCAAQAVSCPANAGGMLVSVLAKKGKDTTQWEKELAIAPKDTFDFLVIVSNQSENPISSVNLKVSLPVEINFAGNLKIDGSSVSDSDIEAGISLGTIPSKTIKTITFSAKAVSEGETSVGAAASNANLSASDYLKIDVAKSSAELATVGSAFSSFFRNNYVLFFFLLIAVIIIFWVLRTAFASLRSAQ